MAATDSNDHVWTVASSHVYFERRIDSLEELLKARIDALAEVSEQRGVAAKEAVGIAMTAAKEAVAKAETAQEKRLEGMNEFRNTLTEQAATFVTNDKMAAEMKLVDAKIATAAATFGQGQLKISNWEGRDFQRAESKQSIQWGIGIAIIIGLAVLGMILKTGVSVPVLGH